MNFSVQDLLNLIGVILSLTPFIGVGYYFGRLEKRITANKQKIKNVDERVSKIELSLGAIR